MAVIPAWQLPGGDGDAVILPSGIPNIRTGGGQPAHTIIVIRKLDTLDPSQRGAIWIARRTANDASNYGVSFEPGNNNIEVQYATSSIFETGANSEAVAGVWVGDCYCDPGNGANIVYRRILFSSGAQTHTATGIGGSVYDDGQAQTYTLGALFNGSSWFQEMDGQIALFLFLNGVVLSQAQCEAFVVDPLNEGDMLCQTHGTSCIFFDDSGTDVGDNDLGIPTLNGAATRTAGIGPDVPVRDEAGGGGGGTAPLLSQVGDLNVVYDGEERVLCLVSNLGTENPLVHLTIDPTGVSGQVLQPFYSYNGSTQLRVHIALGALAPGVMQMFVTNQTPGADFGQRDSLSITVNANPGISQIMQRTAISTQNVASGAAFSLAVAPYVYHSGSQEQGVYSVTGAPPGITMNASTGVLSGTLSAGAETTSPYLVKPRLTDANSNFAEHTYSHAVSTGVIDPEEPPPPAGPRVPGSWGLRGRQST